MQYLLLYSVIMAALIIIATFAIKARAEERKRLRIATLFSHIHQYRDMFEKATDVNIRRDLLGHIEGSLEALAQLGADPKQLNQGHEDLQERTKRVNVQALRKRAQILLKQMDMLFDADKRQAKLAEVRTLFDEALSEGRVDKEMLEKDLTDLEIWERQHDFDVVIDQARIDLAAGEKDKVTALMYSMKTEINAKASKDEEDQRQLNKLDELLAQIEESGSLHEDGAETAKSS